ncbi:amino acid ABC transporter ATP-binding protein [Bifidobacterium sp. ESL0732]|uniref:amino acid ABC transporter ATP-binding protein n=1 Tax=Bifidobacterium sp. ESL0732 TaxID=2983222 RepID=UPI0023F70ADE|nr:amino acid ABC transporter ATP-binding protein [Bifidobacterium sp. ESL0732]WEV63438.1 amino acid ABC transporter ATP-binding protein [Bifidobacterium sp. ESL0732]
MVVRISNIHKNFGSNEVLRGVSIEVPDGKVIGLIGSSGAGKSTLLRCTNFLETPDSGTLEFDGDIVDTTHASKQQIQQLRRQTAMVFQSFNLYKLKTATENIELALTHVKHYTAQKAHEISLEFLNKVGLYDKRNSFPDQLSGGQAQRVALARAAVLRPKLMLLDEPTSALDPENIGEVLKVIKNLADGGQSMLIASHEMTFLRRICDHVVFMDKGVVAEEGSAEQIFGNPRQARTRQFLSGVKFQGEA